MIEATTQAMVSSSTKALIFLSLAWFCLTVGAFTFNPMSPFGIFFICIGIPCQIVSIVYFVRYRLYSMQAKREMEARSGTG
jgi:hypothetical protein